MKKIVEFPKVDLAVYEIEPTDIWLAPSLIKTQDVIAQLSPEAMDRVANYAGFNTAKAAESIFLSANYKWKVFSSVFSDISLAVLPPQCLCSKDGTIIYSFLLDTIEIQLGELIHLYEDLEKKSIEVLLASDNSTECFVSFEKLDSFTTNCIIFYPQKLSLRNLLYRVENDSIKVVTAYNDKLIGKKHFFERIAIDPGNFTYALTDSTTLGVKTNKAFRFSLREIVLFLRTIQNTKLLPSDEETFIEGLLSMLGEQPSGTILEMASNFYNKLHDYFFYYDNQRRLITDPYLIHDKLKNARPYLFFHKNITFTDFDELLSKLLMTELELTVNLSNLGQYDLAYLLALSSYFEKISNMSDEDFDFYTIAEFFTEANL